MSAVSRQKGSRISRRTFFRCGVIPTEVARRYLLGLSASSFFRSLCSRMGAELRSESDSRESWTDYNPNLNEAILWHRPGHAG